MNVEQRGLLGKGTGVVFSEEDGASSSGCCVYMPNRLTTTKLPCTQAGIDGNRGVARKRRLNPVSVMGEIRFSAWRIHCVVGVVEELVF